VDMIATGTDIKPLEIVMFMRSVKSRNFYEQMLGRGVRVMNSSDFRAVTPDAEHKTHFVVVDCVGVSEQALVDTKPLEREPGVSFAKLLNVVAYGNSDADVVSTLAGRLARLDRALGEPERAALAEAAGGADLKTIVSGLVAALDPDRQADEARRQHGLAGNAEPTAEQLARAGARLRAEALRPLAANPTLRERLIEARLRSEQAIDTVTRDDVLEAGYSEAARERATALTRSFAAFIAEHKDEITALQVLYSRPYGRLRYEDVRALARAIAAPPRSWTPDLLWRAYETLDRSKVRGSGHRILTDVVSLVRYATAQESELVPFPEQVAGKFGAWLGQQEAAGRRFTTEQREWLELIRDHIAASVQIEREDFALAPFTERGGLGRVYQVFGAELDPLLEELNEVLVA